MFDIRRNILPYAAHRLFTLDEEKIDLLNVIRLSGGKLSSTVFGQCTEFWPCPLFDILLDKYYPAG
jgi:hypothetical protein